MLEAGEFQVNSYPTISSFRHALSLHAPDIMVLDLNLPDGNGIELCSEFKEAPATKDIPTIIMSAGQAHHGQDCSRAEASIPKPFDIDFFVDAVRRYA